MSARVANGLLGGWLALSGVIWPHSGPQLISAWFCGGLIVTFALLATTLPAARLVNTTLGAWVAVSGFLLPRWSTATVWNNLIVGLAVVGFSLIPSLPLRRGPRPAKGSSPV
jgi:hypothetical protein